MYFIDVPLSPVLSFLSFTLLLDLYVYARRLPAAIYTILPLGLMFFSFVSCLSRELDHFLSFLSLIVVLLALIAENPFAIIPTTHYLYFAFMLSLFNILILPCMFLTTLLSEIYALVFSYVYLVTVILSNILVLLFLSAAVHFDKHIKVTKRHLFLAAILAIVTYSLAIIKLVLYRAFLMPLSFYASLIASLFSFPMSILSTAFALYHIPPLVLDFLKLFYNITYKLVFRHVARLR